MTTRGAATALLPSFRTKGRQLFKTTGIDFAGPFTYKISKKEQGKCYMLIFMCASSRALHLEVTKSKRAEEFKEKLNAFIIQCTRPKRIVSDNGAVFRSTAAWINKIRKCQVLQDYLARQQITCSTCLNRHGGETYIRNSSKM